MKHIFSKSLETNKERLRIFLENGRQETEKEISKENQWTENQMRHDYSEVMKAKDEVIRVLTEEKDFFRHKLCNLVEFRKANFVHRVG